MDDNPVMPAAPDLDSADSPASPVLSSTSSPALPPHTWHNPTTSPIFISSDSPTISIESIDSDSDDSADSALDPLADNPAMPPDMPSADSPASPVLSAASSPALPPHSWHNPTTSPIFISSDDSADSIASLDSLDSVASPLSPTWGHPYHPDLSTSGPPFSPPVYSDIYHRALSWKVDPQTKLAWEGWQLWYSATLVELRTGADPNGTLVPNLWVVRDRVIADFIARFPNDPEPPTVHTFCPLSHKADASNLKFHGIEPPETDLWA